ncbi:MAG: type II toxin-antitoxin system RelE/ParE family toxin [Janthinobacterium lividum]
MPRRIIYYHTERGDSPVQEFIDSLSVKEQAKCLAYIAALRDSPLYLPASIAKKVEGRRWELRPEFGGTEFRLLYFLFLEGAIVFVHALKKKKQQSKRADIELAIRRMNDYEKAHSTHED